MLQFLRKYQKILFGIISIMLFFSFAFFGSYSAMSKTDDVPEVVVAEGIFGNKITHNQIKELSYFLETKEGKEFFEKEILKTGIAQKIYSQFADKLDPYLCEKWKKMKQFVPYKHPDSAHISSIDCWEENAPAIKEYLYRVKKGNPQFEDLVRGYLLQQEFPPYLLQQALFKKQYEERVSLDPTIYHGNFSLFGYQGLREWFSAPFLDLVSCYLLNGAAIAEKEGIKVDVRNKKAPNIYKTILLYQKWMQTSSSFPALEEDFHSFAGEKVKIKEYNVPSFVTDENRYKIALYLKAVYQSASLGKRVSIEEIEKEFPELVFQEVDIEYQHVNEDQLALSIPLKETRAWELSHWEEITERFSLPKEESKEKRYAALTQLAPYKRKEIDAYAATKIIKEKNLAKELVSKTPIEKTTITLSPSYCDFHLPVDSSWFVKNEKSDTFTLFNLGNDLLRLRIINKKEKQLFSLEQAMEYGLLDDLLDRYVKNQWALFQKSHNDLFPPNKSFEQVKEQLCYTLFAEGITEKDFLQWIQAKKKLDPLLNITTSEKEISRADTFYTKAFEAKEGDWVISDNRTCFVVEKKYLGEKPNFSHDAFSYEVKQLQANTLLEKMKDNNYSFFDVQ